MRMMDSLTTGPQFDLSGVSVSNEPVTEQVTEKVRRRPMPGSVKESVSVTHDIPRAALDRAFRRL